MVGMENQTTSYWWWFDSHNNRKLSPWLQSTLAELDEKIKAVLKLIEEDADSFARRAEMYYEKRPELISMVEDLYKTHRSLAEKYDLLKSDSKTCRLSSFKSSISCFKDQPEKLTSETNQPDNCCIDTSDPENSPKSEVEDPEQEEDETQIGKATNKEEPMNLKEDAVGIRSEEMMKLKEEIEKLEAQNKIQNDYILRKDEEKREVIRQLSLALQLLKEENSELRTAISKHSSKKWRPFDFSKLNRLFLGKCNNRFSRVSG